MSSFSPFFIVPGLILYYNYVSVGGAPRHMVVVVFVCVCVTIDSILPTRDWKLITCSQ